MGSIPAGNWIAANRNMGSACPVFKKEFTVSSEKKIKKAWLTITALGIYEAKLNGDRVGEYYFAPGWTAYHTRLQYQEYDITNMLQEQNELYVWVGEGWACGRIGWLGEPNPYGVSPALLAAVVLEYQDGSREQVITDRDWLCAESKIRFSSIYDGEVYDEAWEVNDWQPAALYDYTKETLIPQEGEEIHHISVLKPVEIIKTPKGETVIDFGQNLTGAVRFTVTGPKGALAQLSHGEILDRDGNFYNANLRTARALMQYYCDGKTHTYLPHFTFMGFRYVRVDEWPEEVKAENFEAVVIHSDIKRTGQFECSNGKVNQLYQNIIWGQRGNYLDVPTDCPQRDERLGWTGDAEVFTRAACYNFDVEKFYTKWLNDLKADQFEDGGVPAVIPNILRERMKNSAAWADAALICPWQVYLAYGHKEILENQFESMKKWIEYVRSVSEDGVVWKGSWHFGDWLGLDAPAGSYKGSTDETLIAQAYYAYSTSILIKAGTVLGYDMGEYERLYDKIVAKYKELFIKDGMLTCQTQTAHVLTVYFNLCDQPLTLVRRLAQMIEENGNKLQTGFVGTPYLLHVLSSHGYEELAYTLLLQEDFPSWLYSVNQGATTIWEHWDGMNDKGELWSTDMNSFNHYSYGSVADWMYGVMAGIQPDEAAPGYKHILFAPKTDKRLSYVKASLETKDGTVSSSWRRDNGKISYVFDVPVNCTATITIDGQVYEVGSGHHMYKI
jgi:alpha-L-rhamnosidase